jgi:hypothetical protein
MDVVAGNMPFFDIDIQRRTGLADQLSQTQAYFPAQQWLAILGDPDHVVFEVINGVRGFAVTHRRILLPLDEWSNHIASLTNAIGLFKRPA